MAKIYFICGFIGSGKTTYSKQLATRSQGYRYNLDEWMIPLYGEHMERAVFDARIELLTELFKRQALALLELGVPVIFDFGFWRRADRQAIRHWAISQQLEFQFVYLDSDYALCCERAKQRNQTIKHGPLQEAFEMTPEMLALFWSKFEVPNEAERQRMLCIVPNSAHFMCDGE